MISELRFRNPPALVRAVLLCVCAAIALGAAGNDGPAPVMPEYDAERKLKLPENFDQWVFAGSSLSLSYTEGGTGSNMFHHTLIEPSAYAHFKETGTFREGTMLALLLHGIGEGALPSRKGQYASTLHAVELAVKDSSRVDETWAYYDFGAPGGLRETASPLPARSCHSCHVEHAGYDNVFLQFYPMLVDAAPEGTLPTSLPGARPWLSASAHAQAAAGEQEETPAAPLALRGLDPVLLAEGREELGKPEIEMTVGGLRYQFVSEPSRKEFEESPERFEIQNETCPVVAGASIDPSLFSVHENKIYAFATPGCVTSFEASPETYLE